MLKKVLVFLTYFIFFIFALIYFIPKASAYYLFESKLKAYDVVISNEKICDKMLCLDVTNADIYVDSIKFVNISEANIHLLVVYNRIDITNMTLAPIAKAFTPLIISDVVVTHSIFNPFNINAFATGDFGEAKSTYNILEGTLHVEINPSDLMLRDYTSTLKQFEKTEQGDYIYDKVF